MEQNLIQLYIKEINEALKGVAEKETNDELKKLIGLELKFAKRLRSITGGKQKYKDFIFHIVEDKDLREARPYFRERENMYKDIINPAIMAKDTESLHRLRLNFRFCFFVMETMQNKDIRLDDIYEQIKKTREGIIHKHLHHALNRAKSFSRGIGSVVDFGDLIQLANEALIEAVDKYVIDQDSTSFHNMAFGKMISSLITSSDSSLPVTLWPKASRKLYQIRKILEKTPGINTRDLSQILDTAEEEISLIMNASRYKSLDESLNGSEDDSEMPSITLLDFLPSITNEYNDPYLMIEREDMIRTAAEIFKNLTLLEQKALRLKGVNFKDYL